MFLYFAIDKDDDLANEQNYMIYFTFDTSKTVAAPTSSGGGAFGAAPAPTPAPNATGNSSRRLDAEASLGTEERSLASIPSIQKFVWDPTIGVAYKKPKSGSSGGGGVSSANKVACTFASAAVSLLSLGILG